MKPATSGAQMSRSPCWVVRSRRSARRCIEGHGADQSGRRRPPAHRVGPDAERAAGPSAALEVVALVGSLVELQIGRRGEEDGADEEHPCRGRAEGGCDRRKRAEGEAG